MTRAALFSSRFFAPAGVILVTLSVAAGAEASERYAAIVIDTQTETVLHSEMADELRYPASLTKMMTLYMLFDQLERKQISLNERMTVSRFASRQAPSKLGLKAGATIRVDDAIRAIVTKSANDVAVVLAEKLGGTEAWFAAKMTAKAHAMGMKNTHFVNASGLPDPRQRTTARDMAVLSEKLLADFPQYYSYFQTPGMSWGKRYARNHNRLLGQVDGVDGIKTGFTNASGYNLASSVVRDGRRLVAVVLGGTTAAARDAQVAYLIESAYASLSGKPGVATATALPVTRVAVDVSSGVAQAVVHGPSADPSVRLPITNKPLAEKAAPPAPEKPAQDKPAPERVLAETPALRIGAPLAATASAADAAIASGLF